jgi:dTDP-4-dehydrorhamnose reductase
VLILGGQGFLGAAVRGELRGRDVAAPPRAALDLRSGAAIARYIERLEPQAVVNLAAVNPGQGAAADMATVNHSAAACVADACARRGVRLVHVSSDMVLDGDHAPYTEQALPAPLNEYGATKARGETAVLASGADAVAVRTSLVFDPLHMDRSTRGFADRLEAGQRLELFTDEIRMPVARSTLARALVELIDLPHRGVLNVAGAEALSRFAFGTRLLEWFAVAGRERIAGARSAPLVPRRPRNLTLDLSLARRLLTTRLATVDEELAAARGPEIQP